MAKHPDRYDVTYCACARAGATRGDYSTPCCARDKDGKWPWYGKPSTTEALCYGSDPSASGFATRLLAGADPTLPVAVVEGSVPQRAINNCPNSDQPGKPTWDAENHGWSQLPGEIVWEYDPLYDSESTGHFGRFTDMLNFAKQYGEVLPARGYSLLHMANCPRFGCGADGKGGGVSAVSAAQVPDWWTLPNVRKDRPLIACTYNKNDISSSCTALTDWTIMRRKELEANGVPGAEHWTDDDATSAFCRASAPSAHFGGKSVPNVMTCQLCKEWAKRPEHYLEADHQFNMWCQLAENKKSPVCACIARTDDPEYNNLAPALMSHAGCWFSPCTDVDYINSYVPSEVFEEGKTCPTTICAEIIQAINSPGAKFDHIRQEISGCGTIANPCDSCDPVGELCDANVCVPATSIFGIKMSDESWKKTGAVIGGVGGLVLLGSAIAFIAMSVQDRKK